MVCDLNLVERLRSWAQNEEMIDQHFTKHGHDCNEAAAEIERLRKKTANQRRELRRLNRMGSYQSGFRRGLVFEGEARLRAIMNEAFGHERVREAEHAAIDAARKKVK